MGRKGIHASKVGAHAGCETSVLIFDLTLAKLRTCDERETKRVYT